MNYFILYEVLECYLRVLFCFVFFPHLNMLAKASFFSGFVKVDKSQLLIRLLFNNVAYLDDLCLFTATLAICL